MINSLKDTSTNAINKNIDLVNDKKIVSDKMEYDLQTLNWNLEESKHKEILQNKIADALGIIILLFSLLCFSIIFYYIVGSEKIKNITDKTKSYVLDSIFGLKK